MRGERLQREERGAVRGCAGHTADDDAIRAAEAISL
jgi:hypothetical protein